MLRIDQSVRIAKGDKAATDMLQQSVDRLNEEVETLKAELESLEKRSDDQIEAKANAILESVESLVEEVKAGFSEKTETAQLVAEHGVVGSAVVRDTLTATGVEAETAEIADAHITEIEAESAKLSSVEAEGVEAASVKADSVEAKKLTAEEYDIKDVKADSVETKTVEAESVKAESVEAGRLSCQLLSVSESGPWHEPVGNPDNTELLCLAIPRYDGIVQLVMEDGECSITVIASGLVAFSQRKEIIHRVDFYDTKTEIFFRNEGDALKFQPVFIGEGKSVELTSSLVERTEYPANVEGLRGVATAYACGFNPIETSGVLFVEELPEEDIKRNFVYVVEGDGCYVYDGVNAKFVELLRPVEDAENSDIDLSFVRV